MLCLCVICLHIHSSSMCVGCERVCERERKRESVRVVCVYAWHLTLTYHHCTPPSLNTTTHTHTQPHHNFPYRWYDDVKLIMLCWLVARGFHRWWLFRTLLGSSSHFQQLVHAESDIGESDIGDDVEHGDAQHGRGCCDCCGHVLLFLLVLAYDRGVWICTI